MLYKAHTPNIPAATENQAKICTACDYMIQSALGHVHSTTRVDDENADCLKDGVKLHYECACGEWFKDASATQKISDKASYMSREWKQVS